MTEKQVREAVERWMEKMADRLWLRQFHLTVVYVPPGSEPENAPPKPTGMCHVDHDYGRVEIQLYPHNLDDEDEVFDVLLHEMCHAVAYEFWHVEKDMVPIALGSKSSTAQKMVSASFSYAHERFVQRMMNVVLQAYPYPDSWVEPEEPMVEVAALAPHGSPLSFHGVASGDES